jgi:hypothetical protein
MMAHAAKPFRVLVATALAFLSWTAQPGCMAASPKAGSQTSKPSQKQLTPSGNAKKGQENSNKPAVPPVLSAQKPDPAQLEQVIKADPGALRAVSQYVELKKGTNASVDDYCRELAKMRHAAQAMECARTAQTTDPDTWLQVLASLPSLSVERTQDLLKRQEALRQVLWGVTTCEDPNYRAKLRGGRVDPRTVLIYLQLADGLGGLNGGLRAVCLRSFAAVACLQALAQSKDCPEPSAPALYAQALSPAELKAFEEEMFAEKAVFYRELVSTNAGTSHSRQVTLALLKLHAILAQHYLTERKGSKPWQQRAYHVQRIIELWHSIRPDSPLPESLGISKKEATNVCLSPFWQKLDQDRAACEAEVSSRVCPKCPTPPQLLLELTKCQDRAHTSFQEESAHCREL